MSLQPNLQPFSVLAHSTVVNIEKVTYLPLGHGAKTITQFHCHLPGQCHIPTPLQNLLYPGSQAAPTFSKIFSTGSDIFNPLKEGISRSNLLVTRPFMLSTNESPPKIA